MGSGEWGKMREMREWGKMREMRKLICLPLPPLLPLLPLLPLYSPPPPLPTPHSPLPFISVLFMRKTTLLTIFLVLLGVLPAMAQLGSNTQLGNNLTNDFIGYAEELKNYVNDFAEASKPETEETLRAIDFSSQDAVLGIPEPIRAAQSVRGDIVQKPQSDNYFEHNLALEAMVASNVLDQQMTRGAVVGVLGRVGQARLQGKLQDTGTAIQDVDKYEQSAREAEDICEQNGLLSNLLTLAREGVMPTGAGGSAAQTLPTSLAGGLNSANCVSFQSLIIQSQQARMAAETFAQTAQVNHSLQYSNLNLANISQQMEQANRARRVDTSAEAARLLRATSQVDLLGARTQDSTSGNQDSGVKTNSPVSP